MTVKKTNFILFTTDVLQKYCAPYSNTKSTVSEIPRSLNTQKALTQKLLCLMYLLTYSVFYNYICLQGGIYTKNSLK
jgi:hypothetical protein